MSRIQILLSAVAAVLLVALFYVLLFAPQREALAQLEDERAAELVVQSQLQAEIGRLRLVREGAPEVEAQLAAADAIVPRDAALPSALRQLQTAADDAGLVLQSVSTSPPTPIEGPAPDLAAIEVNVQLLGGYFQVVDFLRRVEDPGLTPRGVAWQSATVTKLEYPELTVVLTGRLFAILTATAPLEPAPTAPDAGDAGDATAEVEDAAADADGQPDETTEDAP